MHPPIRQHLFFDGDDTLWLCNRYYEQAFQAFVAFLKHSMLTPQEVRTALSERDQQHGYGAAAFAKSLRQTYQHLTERLVNDEDLAYTQGLGESILSQPVELIEGVKETLDYLWRWHVLILLTRGDPIEQHHKIEQSGLVGYFQQVIVVVKKDITTYTDLVQKYDLNPATCWMIGDLPRSDIHPALQAGLNAIYIPHPSTWSAEYQNINQMDGRSLLQLQTFSELRDYF